MSLLDLSPKGVIGIVFRHDRFIVSLTFFEFEMTFLGIYILLEY